MNRWNYQTKKLATDTSQCFSKGPFSTYFCHPELDGHNPEPLQAPAGVFPQPVCPGRVRNTHGVHGSSDVYVHPHPRPVEADVRGNEEPSTGAWGVVPVL